MFTQWSYGVVCKLGLFRGKSSSHLRIGCADSSSWVCSVDHLLQSPTLAGTCLLREMSECLSLSRETAGEQFQRKKRKGGRRAGGMASPLGVGFREDSFRPNGCLRLSEIDSLAINHQLPESGYC